MIRFTKMEGLGNDYVYIHGNSQDIPNLKEKIIKMSNRHFGIGSDGVIFIEDSDIADFRMRMFNADGSEGKMCGNGIRCVGKYIYDKKLSDKVNLRIETLSGIKSLYLNIEAGCVHSVKVDMGAPSFNIKDLPIDIDKETIIDYPYTFDGETYHLTAVSMGSPHLVCYCENVADLDLEVLGPRFQSLPILNEPVNIEFVQVIDRSNLKMRVFERGSGETMACGSGACAVLAASYMNGYTYPNAIVHLLGGDLDIEWKEGTVFMAGPAKIVFEGSIKI